MPIRAALVAVAAVLVIVLSLRLGDHAACDDARRAVFGATTGQTPRADVPRHVRAVAERCRGSEGLVAAAGALRTAGDEAAARRLARAATRREPDSFSAWRALASLAQGGEARDARRRATDLNPRWVQGRAPGAAPPGAADAGGP